MKIKKLAINDDCYTLEPRWLCRTCDLGGSVGVPTSVVLYIFRPWWVCRIPDLSCYVGLPTLVGVSVFRPRWLCYVGLPALVVVSVLSDCVGVEVTR